MARLISLAKAAKIKKARQKATSALYRAAHKAELAISKAAYNAANAVRIAAQRAKHRSDHLERYAAREGKYRKSHRKQINATAKEYGRKHKKERDAYRKLNKERIDRSNAAYRAAHPYKAAIDEQNRRARIAGAVGKFTSKEFIALCAKYDNRCLGPGPHSKGNLQPDHVKPLSKGGTNSISNIQPLCQHCNDSKGTKTIDYRKSLTK